MYLPAGYVKLEGATVNRENYPRLVALADTYSLWTSDTASNPGLFGEGDGSTTMTLPNWTGRMAQFAATAGSAVAAGLPNIKGSIVSASGNPGASAGGIGNFRGATGAFALEELYQYHASGNISSNDNHSTAVFDASTYQNIYSASTTVQPPAINTFAIMRY